MDYEKKYNEAIERMRKMLGPWRELAYNGKSFLQDLESIFPELRESEDERIRRFLLEYAIEMIAGLESDISLSIYDGIKGHDPDAEAELAQWQKARAYLEKQKEQKPKMTPKWLYRLEFKDSSCGLWYDGTGKWCFESGIGSIAGCKTKTLPMDYDVRYKQDGRDWFSSCSQKEDLMHWYSLEDAKELISKGFVFTRYLATEYHEYEQQTVFIKETALYREEIDIFELFGQKPVEWSEEDEKKIHFLSRLIEFQVKDGEYCFGDGACAISKQEAIEMLQSLRPSWKPSEEQMEVLLNAEGLVRANNYNENAKILASLYEQLKKL